LTSKYEKNWKFLIANYNGDCSFCKKQIFQFDEIFWNRFSKKIQHSICFKQSLKLFNTKFSASCAVCSKKIYKKQESFYDISKKKIIHTSCIDMDEHLLTESVKSIKKYIKDQLEKIQKNTNSKISLIFNPNADSNNVIQLDSNQYEIVLNGKVSVKSALDHELAHINFESLNGWSKYLSILRDWVSDVGISSKDDIRIADEILQPTFNIMEDIRIEYLDGVKEPNKKNSYGRCLKNIGQSFVQNIFPTPVSFLLYKRFFREDLIFYDFQVEIDEIFQQSKCNSVTKLLDILKDWLNFGSLGYYILDTIRKKSAPC